MAIHNHFRAFRSLNTLLTFTRMAPFFTHTFRCNLPPRRDRITLNRKPFFFIWYVGEIGCGTSGLVLPVRIKRGSLRELGANYCISHRRLHSSVELRNLPRDFELPLSEITDRYARRQSPASVRIKEMSGVFFCGLGVCPAENFDHCKCAASCFCVARSPGGTSQRSPPWKRWGAGCDHSQPRRGGTHGSPCAAPSRLGPLPSHIPTARAVGYVLSSLKGLAKVIRAILRSVGQTPRGRVRTAIGESCPAHSAQRPSNG